MEEHIWWIIGVAVTVVLTLIGVIYASLVGRIERLITSTDKGLDLKVDESTYQVSHQYERELFEGMKLSIKELKDENSTEHRAIMIEIKRMHE